MFLNSLIPEGKFSKSGGARVNALFLQATTVISYTMGMAYYAYSTSHWTLLLSFMHLALFLLCVPLAIRYIHNTNNLEAYFFLNLSLAPFFACLSTNGVSSPFFIWFIAIPVSAFFYLRKATIKKWISICCAFITLLFILDITGLAQSNSFTPSEYIIITSISCLFIFAFIAILMNLYITQYIKRRKVFMATKEKLEKSNEDLQNFAYVASHDLQTPLKSINSMTKVLRKHKKGSLNKEEENTLQYVEKSTVKLSNLIKEILQFSKAGTEVAEPKVLDLNQVIDKVKKEIIDSKKYDNFSIKAVNLKTIYADPKMVSQVFHHIIDNALKYNSSEHKIVEVEQREYQEKQHFLFVDNGLGVAPENHERIFGIFNRTRGDSGIDGAGIGLAVCKKMIMKQKGRIWLESELGKGSTFNITFPSSKKRLTA